jgi:cellulose biosynthesis protein BcsQ
MSKIISVFSHKGGVGKTTFIYNIAFELAERNKKVLLIDADSQMNLTSSIFGKFLDVDYSKEKQTKNNDDISWDVFLSTYRNFVDYFSLNDESKPLFKSKLNSNVHLISSSLSIDTSVLEWTDIVLGSRIENSQMRDPRLLNFQDKLLKLKNDYDYIFIDMAPSASNIINAMLVCSSDYFIVPVFPNFFSLQAVNNLADIFETWKGIFKKHSKTGNYRGFDIRVKFLGLILNRSAGFANKRNQNKYTKATREWTEKINERLSIFIDNNEKNAITAELFHNFFEQSIKWVIENVVNIPNDLDKAASKNHKPFLSLTTKDHNNLSLENNSHKKAFDKIKLSYKYIIDSFEKFN